MFETKSVNSAGSPSLGTLTRIPSSLIPSSILIRYKRPEDNVGRRDFLTNLVNKVRMGDLSHEEMAAHSSTLV